MKILTTVLKRFIPNLPNDIDLISKTFTNIGYEVEEVYAANQIEGVVLSEVLECKQHENADKLSHCKIKHNDEILDVVCGGANISGGQLVAWAKPGSKVGEITLAPKELRGVVSNGMVLSISEIGGFSKDLVEDAEKNNIVVFDKAFNENIEDALWMDGHVIELSILPDRQYASNINMLAKELAVALDLEYINPGIPNETTGQEDIALNLGENALGLAATKVKLKESKTKLKYKSLLYHNGIKPTDTIEDIFRLASIVSGNTVYMLDADDITLDKNLLNGNNIYNRIELDGSTIVAIASKNKANPMQIKELDNINGLRNTRTTFEDSIEFTLQLVIHYALNSGFITEASDIVIKKINEDKIIESSDSEILEFIGDSINIDESKEKLFKLNIKFEENKVYVPSYRRDISGVQDLVEEVLRFTNINELQSKKPTINVDVLNKDVENINNIRNTLINSNLNEVRTYQLISNKYANEYNIWNFDTMIKVKEEFGIEYNTMQTSLLSGLLEVYKTNYRKEQEENINVFEIQNIFHSYEENKTHLGILIDDSYQSDVEGEQTLKLKKLVETIFENAEFKEIDLKIFNKYNSADIYVSGSKIGTMGEIHPKILRENKFIRVDKVKTRLYYLELILENNNI